jgi:hypothetical protein
MAETLAGEAGLFRVTLCSLYALRLFRLQSCQLFLAQCIHSNFDVMMDHVELALQGPSRARRAEQHTTRGNATCSIGVSTRPWRRSALQALEGRAMF